jgi:hypothetical protein
MPPRWTQVHHCRHWRDGGATDRWNLLLLCEEHHRAAHSGLFVVVLHGPGMITIRASRPGEALYEIRTADPPRDDQLSIPDMLASTARRLRTA